MDYYHLIDMEAIGTEMYGKDFVAWAMKRLKPNEFLFDLARESGVVLLPGKGFGSTHPSARVSLANLKETDYVKIGKALSTLANKVYAEYLKSKKDGKK